MCGEAPGCRAGRLDSSSLSSSGWGSWSLGCPAGRSSRSPGWCAPAPPAAELAPAPPPKWRRSCSKSSRTCGACGLTGPKWCPNRHRCRCCRYRSPAPEEVFWRRSVCSQFGRTPLAPGPAGSRRVQCTLRRQNTERPARGFLKRERKLLSRTTLKRRKHTQLLCAHANHGLWRGTVSNDCFTSMHSFASCPQGNQEGEFKRCICCQGICSHAERGFTAAVSWSCLEGGGAACRIKC